MSIHIFGIFYTIIFVVLCKMFVETFEEKRDLPGKWYRYVVIVCMIALDYAVSVLLDDNIVLKEIVIIGLGTFFMWLYFQQKCSKIAILVLLYQGLCFVIDYISIIMMAKFFPVITIERLSEPLVNFVLGALS